MPRSPSPSGSASTTRTWSERILPVGLPQEFPDDPTHPLQITLRTYALALSLSLGPSLIPFVTALVFKAKGIKKNSSRTLKYVLRRELGVTGFAFAITFAVGGGLALQRLWAVVEDARELPWDLPGTFTPRAPSPEAQDPNAKPTSSIRASFQAWLSNLTPSRKAFLSNVISSSIAILLLQAGRRRHTPIHSGRSAARGIPDGAPIPLTVPLTRRVDNTSPTLDLTLLLLVRAVDALVQTFVFARTDMDLARPRRMRDSKGRTHTRVEIDPEALEKEWEKRERERRRRVLTSRIDAVVFWACSARIMWCFFYEPQRLPRSYVKWITSLANVDRRLLRALRAIKSGEWSYVTGASNPPNLLTTYAKELGYPSSWGDPALLPAYGTGASAVWKNLGVTGRGDVGGLPCELVHAGVAKRIGLGECCLVNTLTRGAYAFLEAFAIYFPAHFFPLLITRPRSIFRLYRLIPMLLGVLRSATFLSTFVSSIWLTVCFTRTLALARLLPYVSHDVWDGPFGCITAGSLVCGASIWIENGRRRGEMALYVLPRAVRACLPDTWIKSGNRGVRWAECLAFILSLSSLLTAAIHRPESLRGLSRWTAAFIMNGPNAGFWKRKRTSTSGLQTPADPIPTTPLARNNATNIN